ncbi:hypothetical protein HO133_001390 [Letharia lupina]|uniref:Uncharacterized protein n=1 Tax=Letharia lupina TaxID=560253 RepID=A0A8H6FC23_9LECA|nr:uncharacterized protein HO133_001390 [Letharia lupina]KAF6222304.1 hypothetical protein HO133_001390 [Letharia lupina]
MYNLASQIRSPKLRTIRTDIDIYKKVDGEIKSEYIKMRKRAELQGIEQIVLQSRKLLTESRDEEADLEDKCLIQRLQKANHARRQLFECWRRSKQQSIQAASKAIETVPSSQHHDERLTRVPKHHIPSSVQLSEISRLLLSSVPALPKDYILRGNNKYTYSGTSPGLTVHGLSGEKTSRKLNAGLDRTSSMTFDPMSVHTMVVPNQMCYTIAGKSGHAMSNARISKVYGDVRSTLSMNTLSLLRTKIT